MFETTGNKGFHMTFANGNTISVQFGYGNYCENYNADFNKLLKKEDWKSKDAEVATWDKEGNWNLRKYFPDLSDDVKGQMSSDDVLALMNKIASE